MEINFIIPTNPRPKKNNPRIMWKKSDKPFQIKFGNFVGATIQYRPLIIPSNSNEEFEEQALPILRRVRDEIGIIDFPCNIQAIYYRDTKHRIDLTNLHEALHDAMVKANLLLDDNRDLIAGTDGSRVFYDKTRPRIEVKITEMKDYTQWNDTTSKQLKMSE